MRTIREQMELCLDVSFLQRIYKEQRVLYRYGIICLCMPDEGRRCVFVDGVFQRQPFQLNFRRAFSEKIVKGAAMSKAAGGNDRVTQNLSIRAKYF